LTQAEETYASISGLEYEILELFKRTSGVVIFIEGRRESGKTDMSLYIAEVLAEFKAIPEFASNIKIIDSPFPINRITNMQDLNGWLGATHGRKLYILDEAGKAIRRRTPMDRLNINILDCIQVIRHHSGNLIFIAPADYFIDSAMLGSDILDVRIRKWNFKNPKVGVWFDLMEDRRIDLTEIPKTKVLYDTHDIAPFTKTDPNAKPIFKDDDLRILWDWSHGMNSTQLGLTSLKIHRLTKKYIKDSLELTLSPL
jgi:hypothetical protein